MYAVESWDALVIALYFAALVLISLYFVKSPSETPHYYFLSNRNLGWIVIGTSIFAASISSEHFLGLAEYSAKQDLAIANYELILVMPLLLLGWCLAPLLLRANIYTIPEYFGKRFDKRTQLYLSGFMILFYLIIRISVSLLAGGLLLNLVFDWDIYTSSIVIMMITGIYTIMGGLTVVVYTSVFQAIIIILGVITLTFFGLNEVGGVQAIQKSMSSIDFTMFKPVSDPDFPWTGILFGAPIIGIGYWCTDQYIIQRILAAKSVSSARNSTILVGFLKTFSVLFIVIASIMTVVIIPGVEENQALASLLYSNLLPSGFKGIVVTGVLAALMSSLSGAFISSSSLITMDFFRYFQPHSSEKKLVLVGRLATIFMVVIGILWIPILKIVNLPLYPYILKFQAYFAPPIVAIFILGLLWKRMNSRSAVWTLIIGLIPGIVRTIPELLKIDPILNHPFFDWFFSINYLHYGILLFLFSLILATTVTLISRSKFSTAIDQYMLTSGELTVIFHGKKILSRGERPEQFAWIFSFVLMIILVGFWGLFL